MSVCLRLRLRLYVHVSHCLALFIAFILFLHSILTCHVFHRSFLCSLFLSVSISLYFSVSLCFCLSHSLCIITLRLLLRNSVCLLLLLKTFLFGRSWIESASE